MAALIRRKEELQTPQQYKNQDASKCITVWFQLINYHVDSMNAPKICKHILADFIQ